MLPDEGILAKDDSMICSGEPAFPAMLLTRGIVSLPFCTGPVQETATSSARRQALRVLLIKILFKNTKIQKIHIFAHFDLFSYGTRT